MTHSCLGPPPIAPPTPDSQQTLGNVKWVFNNSPYLPVGTGGKSGLLSRAPRAGLSSLIALPSPSDLTAARALALSQRDGCPGDQVTAQPQVSRMTFGPS